MLRELPAKSVILDGEIVASDFSLILRIGSVPINQLYKNCPTDCNYHGTQALRYRQTIPSLAHVIELPFQPPEYPNETQHDHSERRQYFFAHPSPLNIAQRSASLRY